jgi:spore coat polysaccharide biosynthesis predicted glycosyltransferase SpsG/RimJ/RimL family protein N-acetyltransferase
MRALLRCDATPEGGVGHLVRCLALAHEARDRGWDVALAGTVTVPLAQRLVGTADVRVVGTAALTGSELARLAVREGADLLHVDHYAVATDLRPALEEVGIVLSSIEDGTFGRRPADVVVDSTLGAQEHGRPADGSGDVLLGIRYAPMRASVLAARASGTARRDARAVGTEPPRVLVVMGGTDATGATAAVVRELLRAAGAGVAHLTVVVPEERRDEVRRAAEPAVTVLGPQDDLPMLAVQHDLVLTAAGTTVWELACAGCAMGVAAVTENQLVGYARAVGTGVAAGLGTLEELVAGRSSGTLRGLLADAAWRDRLGDVARGLVDGHGAARVVEAWERWCLGARRDAGLEARPATASDAELLRGWRNDPSVRSASRSTEEITAQAHVAWLTGVLEDDARVLLVVEQDGKPLGTVRFDRLHERLWEVSITLAPDARGRGLAHGVLAAAETAWRRQVGDGPAVLACVRPANASSARLFLRAGYRPAPEHADGTLDAYVKS